MCDYFCTTLQKSNTAKVINTFAKIKECREALAISRPDVLILGPDLPGDKEDANWINFCTKIRKDYPAMKILAVISHDEYIISKESLNSLMSGYISKDALPDVIISAVKAVTEGEFFCYDKVTGPVKDQKLDENPVWLNTMMQEMIKNMNIDGYHQEMIDKLSQIIDEYEINRMKLIKILLEKEKDNLDDDSVNKYLKMLIESLLVKGHSNWDIANMLNIRLDTIRIFRMELILKLTGINSVAYTINRNGQPVELGQSELRLLRLIAAGYTNEEIAKNLYKAVETIKSERKNLIGKLDERNSTTMIINALRKGLIKMEDLDKLENE